LSQVIAGIYDRSRRTYGALRVTQHIPAHIVGDLERVPIPKVSL